MACCRPSNNYTEVPMKGVVVSIFAALSLAFAEPTSPPDSAKLAPAYSWAFGKLYESSFTQKMFRNSPAWNDDTENPPLPAGKALKLATEMKDSLVKDS